jgi:flagellar assembly protein FliH
MASSDDFAKAFVRYGASANAGAKTPLVPKDAKVEPFRHPALKEKDIPTYHQIKSTFRADVGAKSARFSLSDLVADQLSVEAEELRRFERKVNEEVENRLSILRREAQELGHKEGLERGRAKGYDEEKARLAALMERLASSANAMEKAKESLSSHYERVLVDMAFRLAELVVHAELKQRPESIYHTISAILDRIGREEDVRVRMSSADFEAIDKVKSQVEGLGRVGRISFDADSSIRPGDCVVESSSGEIASVVEEKLAKLKEEMLSSLTLKFGETGT